MTTELETTKNMELEGTKIVLKGELDYGTAVEADITVKVDAVEALKVIAEKTSTDKDDKFIASAEPYIRMIMEAIDK